MRVHRVYFHGGLYTDQIAANGAAARLYAAREFPKLGAAVKTKCLTLVVNGRRTHVHPKLDRSFLLLELERESARDDYRHCVGLKKLQMASGIVRSARLAIDIWRKQTMPVNVASSGNQKGGASWNSTTKSNMSRITRTPMRKK